MGAALQPSAITSTRVVRATHVSCGRATASQVGQTIRFGSSGQWEGRGWRIMLVRHVFCAGMDARRSSGGNNGFIATSRGWRVRVTSRASAVLCPPSLTKYTLRGGKRPYRSKHSPLDGSSLRPCPRRTHLDIRRTPFSASDSSVYVLYLGPGASSVAGEVQHRRSRCGGPGCSWRACRPPTSSGAALRTRTDGGTWTSGRGRVHARASGNVSRYVAREAREVGDRSHE